jgi:hypothetical protein
MSSGRSAHPTARRVRRWAWSIGTGVRLVVGPASAAHAADAVVDPGPAVTRGPSGSAVSSGDGWVRYVRALVALSATAAVLATAPSAVASDEVLASLPADAIVGLHMSAYGGHVVWSEAVAPGRHVLMRWHAGRVDRLPVAERAVPFDVDLGPDARGRPVAVYSRCPGEGESTAPVGGCDVYRIALQRGRERRIRRFLPRHRRSMRRRSGEATSHTPHQRRRQARRQ